MARQTKYPPIFSLCLPIARRSDGHILMSNLGSQAPKELNPLEFPRSLYSEVLEIPLSATLENRPSEELLLECASTQIHAMAGQSHPVVNVDSLLYLGLYESPNWGACMHYLKYYVLVMVEDADIMKPSDMEWHRPSELVALYMENKIRLSPPTLGLLRALVADLPGNGKLPLLGGGSHTHRFWHALSQEIQSGEYGVSTHLEFAPGIEHIPIASNTLMPFHATNLTTIRDDGVLLIVDPGANDLGKAHLENVLARFSPTSLLIFLTHHHHDHIHSLGAVEKLFPNATLIGHPYTLKKINSKLARKPVCENDTDESLLIGSERQIKVLSLPGHTRGHLALWDEPSKTLISGDHTVGYGSSVLDPHGGGHMLTYLESTKRLLTLDIQVILPCHGAPTLVRPTSLLQSYLNHRVSREKTIRSQWESGMTDIDVLVKTIYSETPEKLHPIAKRNVLLHLEKLADDKEIELTEAVQALVKEYRSKD